MTKLPKALLDCTFRVMEELGEHCHVVFVYFVPNTTWIGGLVSVRSGKGMAAVLHACIPPPLFCPKVFPSYGEFFCHSMYVVFNLRSCHLRLTLGRPPPSMHSAHIYIVGREIIIGRYTEELRSGHPVQYLNNMYNQWTVIL